MRNRRSVSAWLGLFAILWGQVVQVFGATLTLKDGREMRGKVVPLAKIGDAGAQIPAGIVPPIVMVDDDLARRFFNRREIQSVNEQQLPTERFVIKQPVPESGSRITSAGPIVRVTQFDEWGRRILSMQVGGGKREDIIQGITEITPIWTKVEALKNFLWDQRIATSSIPRKQLSSILKQYTDPKRLEDRLKVVRLFIHSERYSDAEAELSQIVEDFPEEKVDLSRVLTELNQVKARRILSEIQIRATSGQHQLALRMLEKFPAENVAAETLQEIRDRIDGYQSQLAQATDTVQRLKDHHAAVEHTGLRERLKDPLEEVFTTINIHNTGRLATYRRLADDAELRVEEKLSLAISGWLLGADSAERNLSVSLGVYELRGLVREYFNESVKINRERLLERIRGKEGSDPERLSKLLANMAPPFETPTPQVPGFYELTVPGLVEGEEFTYFVQLPPEYNPYHRYPAIVTLHGSGTSPEQQISWWAGDRDDNDVPQGQAARQGYIVIAPAWGVPHQKEYQFESREHAAVLNTLRDACRRFSIDTDKVFLTGHSMGGMAAWDIGMSHPDLWAGVMPLVAFCDKYIERYWPNARRLPLYFVGGQLDNAQMAHNGVQYDKYLLLAHYRCTVVEYKGRGHEDFSDEIQHLFQWMNRQRRDFYPLEFTMVTLRPWDNFFWWVETSGHPEKTVVLPDRYETTNRAKAMNIECDKSEKANTITVSTGADAVTLWLSPEIIDFKEKANIRINGKRVVRDGLIEPDIEVMLDDVRTRGDRQHPFWLRIDHPSGK